MNWVNEHEGHYTFRTSEILPRGAMEKHGFFYADTLIEPWVNKDRFRPANISNDISINETNYVDERIEKIAKTEFVFGRFNRDITIPAEKASLRYFVWLKDILAKKGTLFSLNLDNKTVGFLACLKNKIVLHALDKSVQGRKLSGQYWTLCFNSLFDDGFDELYSSVSVSNLPIVNLYSSLGFLFKNFHDIYHKRVFK